MKSTALVVAAVLAAVSLLVILVDAIPVARAALQRRRRARAGSYGVVMDSRGRELGTYLDPFAPGRRGARVHREESPWAAPGPDGWSGWAWEGFGTTPEKARLEADRLRRRYLQLLPWLGEGEAADEEWRE